MRERGLTVGELFGELRNQARANAPIAAASAAVLVAANLAIDGFMKDSPGSFAASGTVSLGAQYLVTRRALQKSGLLSDDAPGRFGSFWGMNIITGLAIALGCVLLIVPGIFVAARWFVAGPAILAEEKTAGEGMSESWELTKESTWHIVGAVLVLYLCGFGIGMVPLFFYGETNPPLTVMVFSYSLIFSSSVLGWLMSVGAYRMITPSYRSLEEVFA